MFIGLGDAQVIDSVTIIWDDNSSSMYSTVELNSFIRITQGISDIQDQMDLSVSTSDLTLQNDLIIYPNIIDSGSRTINVLSESDFDQNTQVILYDMNGRSYIPQYDLSSELIQLTTQFLPAGVYVLSVRDQFQSRNVKVVVSGL